MTERVRGPTAAVSKAWTRPVTVSVPWRPLTPGVAVEVVLPSKTLVSVTAEMSSTALLMTKVALPELPLWLASPL